MSSHLTLHPPHFRISNFVYINVLATKLSIFPSIYCHKAAFYDRKHLIVFLKSNFWQRHMLSSILRLSSPQCAGVHRFRAVSTAPFISLSIMTTQTTKVTNLDRSIQRSTNHLPVCWIHSYPSNWLEMCCGKGHHMQIHEIKAVSPRLVFKAFLSS